MVGLVSEVNKKGKTNQRINIAVSLDSMKVPKSQSFLAIIIFLLFKK